MVRHFIPSKRSFALEILPMCLLYFPLSHVSGCPQWNPKLFFTVSPLTFQSNLRYNLLARPIFFQSHPAAHPGLPPTISCFFCHQPPSWLVSCSDLPSSILTEPPPSWSCSSHENTGLSQADPVALSVILMATRILQPHQTSCCSQHTASQITTPSQI